MYSVNIFHIVCIFSSLSLGNPGPNSSNFNSQSLIFPSISLIIYGRDPLMCLYKIFVSFVVNDLVPNRSCGIVE